MKKISLGLILFLLITGCDTASINSESGEDLFFLENDQAIMPVRVKGNKASKRFVIFLHGGPGGNIVDARDFLDKPMQPIEEHVAMVYWDQRCAGSSQGNCDRMKLSFNAYTEDLDKLIVLLEHHYGPDIELYLMTHSFGGWLATVYLAENNNQDRFSGWINMDGAYSAPFLFNASRDYLIEVGSRQIQQGNKISAWQSIIDEVNTLDLDTLDGKERLNTIGYEAPDLMAAVDSINGIDVKGNLSDLFKSPGSQLAVLANSVITANAPFSKEVFGTDDTERLQRITIPVLLLWGKYDFVVPPATINDFNLHIGSSQVESVIFQRSEHTPMATEPEAFAEAVVRFLN